MSSKTYVGVTALPRYVIRTQTRGGTYYYFRRKPFPIVRLPGGLSWRSSSTSTPIRSHRGKRSSRAELPMFLVPAAAMEPRSRPWT